MPFQKNREKTGGRKSGTPNRKKDVNFDFFASELINVIKGHKYYVYKHEINGVCFYVGKGKGTRAWDKTRNDVWNKFVRSIGSNYEIRLIALGLTESEALTIEESLIKLLNPECNKTHLDKELSIKFI